MSVIKSNGAGDQSTGFYSYTIGQSLRFNDADNGYLHRTPSDTNERTWTWSGWIKRGNLGSGQGIFGTDTSNTTNFFIVQWLSNDALFIQSLSGGTETVRLSTTKKFRDTGGWYHIVIAADTTQSTASNRLKIYVNGEILTAYDSGSEKYPTSVNLDTFINNSSFPIMVGAYDVSGTPDTLSGYLAEINFIDGAALTPSSFGETKDSIWVAKSSSGLTFGTNGFYLPFDDSSAIGDDESSNTNDLTVVNLAATDVVLDSPTNSWCTLNPLDNISTTYSEANLKIAQSSFNLNSRGTMAVSSGKWYWEIRMSNTHGEFGVCENGKAGQADPQANIGFNFIYNNGSAGVSYKNATAGSQSTGSISMTNWAADDICQIAYDADNGILYHGLNGTYQTSGDPAAGSGGLITGIAPQFRGTMVPFFGVGTDSARTFIVNFGQDSSFAGTETAQGNADGGGVGDFYYAPPSGFLALCSKNLPDPEIIDGTEHFNTVLYSGNSSSQAITSLDFSPDFVWTKRRSASSSHYLSDSVRGGHKAVFSDTADAEYDGTSADDGVESFDSNGFTLKNGTYVNDYNASGSTYVAWNWLAGTAASGSESGNNPAFSSSSNATAGFSIVAYTGTGSAGTVGHGCGAVPGYIIIKNRDAADNWAVYYGDNTDYLILNSNSASADSAAWWNDTTPTDSVFTVGTDHAVNADGEKYIAYCFAPIDGYTKSGSFAGNGTKQFVHLGFRPAFVLWKRTSSSGWNIADSVTDPINEINSVLHPNTAAATSTVGSQQLLFVSNGFVEAGYANDAGTTLAYLAFAEQPFKFANAR